MYFWNFPSCNYPSFLKWWSEKRRANYQIYPKCEVIYEKKCILLFWSNCLPYGGPNKISQGNLVHSNSIFASSFKRSRDIQKPLREDCLFIGKEILPIVKLKPFFCYKSSYSPQIKKDGKQLTVIITMVSPCSHQNSQKRKPHNMQMLLKWYSCFPNETGLVQIIFIYRALSNLFNLISFLHTHTYVI